MPKKTNTIREDNAALTGRAALITGTRWCQSCSRYANASTGREREVRSRHGFVKRWICGTCKARKNGQ